MSSRIRNFWIEAALLIALVVATGAAIIVSLNQPLKSSDIELAAADLRSFAAVGRLLADQRLTGNLTETFFDTQVSLLDEKVGATHKTLSDSAVEPKAEGDRQLAADVAKEVSAAIQQLKSLNGNEPEVMGRFDELATKAGRLEDRLKQ
jgi:hypothetical protein